MAGQTLDRLALRLSSRVYKESAFPSQSCRASFPGMKESQTLNSIQEG